MKNKFEGEVAVTINNLGRENEELKRKIKELDGLLKNSNGENENLKRQWRESENVTGQRF